MKKVLLVVLAITIARPLMAEVRLPSLISSNMVLQQQSAAHLWGWAGPADKVFVTTSWNHKIDSVVASRDAKWSIAIPTPVAGGPYTITIQSGNTIELQNVMIGEVWVCSGQSNMEMNAGWGPNALPEMTAELPGSANSKIRLFQSPRTAAAYPQDNITGSWKECNEASLKSFSAVGYFFGKSLQNKLDVPVGLINVSWGGTSADVWTPAEVIQNDLELSAASRKLTPYAWWPNTPGACYNAMIAPLLQMDIAGVIWYQGEGNTEISSTYNRVFSAMINSWRRGWNKQFPFYYVQIAPFTYGGKDAGAILREQQQATLNLPDVGMVVTTDLVDTITDIHPKQKRAVGNRLAAMAMSQTYHVDMGNCQSPVFSRMETGKGRVVCYFTHADNGLVIKGATVKECYIAGEDRRFVPATVKTEGDHIIVSSTAVAKPVAVRFGYSNAGIGNIFSTEGLPVAPFRTDNWSNAITDK
ncbi:sialate O-acetylesterase [Filimonas lacunae]|uniref:Sialate O-acetylesterase n=1 Tax=Filimonas lacunae TaxID=477680 RepID=A0A173ME58_9BACT|nr:sialate O-acetylesterase [Filimonas lacunae]BAV05769.1 sialic acid-specific 9-O-acetylesterase [Filimonas lacunae]SIT28675.1 sialate O-acetylesterase [Filimonas lacunae]